FFTDYFELYKDATRTLTQVVEADTNTSPIANPGGPYLGAINTAILFDGSGSFDDEGDPLTYAWTFGDGGSGDGATPAYSYAATGVYEVCLVVDDGLIGSEPACTLAVVYDPEGGFVTGGGWIDSPAGAYRPDLDLSGKATFGFVSKYKKGTTVPEGNTEFQFQAGGFNFHSTAYDWLVVSKDQVTAQFKGSGTVNDGLDPNGNAYKFTLWAGDGSPDTFRIRIWWEDADAVEYDVYDNGFNQAIGGGSIVVHVK
ncbi:MAG: PKD domain-containing protein, partial [Anaerolineae bacterium]